jgi:hypothetical protein
MEALGEFKAQHHTGIALVLVLVLHCTVLDYGDETVLTARGRVAWPHKCSVRLPTAISSCRFRLAGLIPNVSASPVVAWAGQGMEN